MLLTSSIAALIVALPPEPVTPSAETSRLDDAPAEVGESITLKTQDKLELTATYFAPRAKRGKSPAALLIHDFGANRKQLLRLATYLQKKGFGVLAVDVRGHGDSMTERLCWDRLDENGRLALWSHAVKDTTACAEFLRKKPELHASNLTLIGFGAGCSLAVRHADKDENVRAVVLLGLEPESLGLNMVRGISGLEGLPTLIVASQDRRHTIDRIRNACRDANEGETYVDVAMVRSEASRLLSDKQLHNKTYTWLRNQVMPRRR